MVIDASALLAVLLEEPYGEWVVRMLENHLTSLCMSTVNLTETLIILADRRKGSCESLEDICADFEEVFHQDLRATYEASTRRCLVVFTCHGDWPGAVRAARSLQHLLQRRRRTRAAGMD